MPDLQFCELIQINVKLLFILQQYLFNHKNVKFSLILNSNILLHSTENLLPKDNQAIFLQYFRNYLLRLQ